MSERGVYAESCQVQASEAYTLRERRICENLPREWQLEAAGEPFPRSRGREALRGHVHLDAGVHLLLLAQTAAHERPCGGRGMLHRPPQGCRTSPGFFCARSRLASSLVTAESPSVASSRWENRVVPQAMVVVRLLRIFFVREMADVLVYAALPGSALHFPRAARGAGDSRTTARHGWSPTVPRISRITAETDIRLPRELSSGPDTTSFLLSTQLRSPPAEATQLRSPPAAATQLRGPSQNQSEVPALFSHLSYAPLPLSLPPPLLRRSISCSRPLSGGSSGSAQEWVRFYR